METQWIQLSIFLFSILVFSPLFGFILHKIYTCGTSKFEVFLYKLCGIDPKRNMDWREYSISLLGFNFFGFYSVVFNLTFSGISPSQSGEISRTKPGSGV